MIVSIPTPSPELLRYYQSGIVLWIVATVWGFAVPALVYFTGLSTRVRELAQRMTRRWFAATVIGIALLAFIFLLADIPLDYYADFLRPHEYGLSSQTFGKWAHDELLNIGIGIIGAAVFLWIPFLLLKKATKRWWLYTWFASIPILVFVTFIQPIWIDPLFNHFGPMQDKPLETRILDLAHRAGIAGARVYEVNKSVDTNEFNAYVTGIGGTSRIVLWDTTVKDMEPDQIALITGHEMGHYVLGHTWKGLLAVILVLLPALWFVHRSGHWALRRFSSRTGISELGDVAALPLLVLIFTVFAFVLMPPLLAGSRHFEHEADRFGLEITHDNRACGTSFVKFMQHDLAYPYPSPIMQFLRASHPSLGDRVDFCNTYHPWREGKDGRYSGYFLSAPGR